jgi:hypothetical protein
MKPTVLFENVPHFLVQRFIEAAAKTHQSVTCELVPGQKDIFVIACEKSSRRS